jgi:putative transposase
MCRNGTCHPVTQSSIVADAFVMAIWRGRPEALLHHSDRSRRVRERAVQWLTADHGGLVYR